MTEVEAPDHIEDLATRINESGELLQQLAPRLPKTLSDWLARLTLGYGLPFENLVADERMLPRESIRFFYVDTNWLESLVDGAFSVGAHSERDIRYHRVMQHVIRQSTESASGQLRRQLRGEDIEGADGTEDTGGDTEGDAEPTVRGGFLMRSALVSGWPGLEVKAFAGADETSSPVELLRLERLSPSVLLAIFAAVPELVVIHEPTEDLHFGITAGQVLLRDPETGARLGKDSAGADLGVTAPWRDEEARVLDVTALHHALGDALAQARGDLGRNFGAADFGIQMVDAADKQHFVPPEGDE